MNKLWKPSESPFRHQDITEVPLEVRRSSVAKKAFLECCFVGDFSNKTAELLRESRCEPCKIRNYVANEADEDFGWAPVHYAAKNGELNFIKLLVNYCCDPAEVGNHMWVPLMHMWVPLETPLHIACRYGHLSIVKYLVTSCKCNPESKDGENRSPLHAATACGHEDIVKFLMGNFNCDPLCRDSKGQTPLYLAATLEHTNVTMYMSSVLGCTPLHVACEKGDRQEVSRLLSDDPEMVNERDKYGKTPLHYACITEISIIEIFYTNKSKVITRKEPTVATILENKACNPNICDNKYKTPLFSAMSLRNYEALRLLLQSDKCDPNTIITGKGCSAPHADCSYENCDLETTLHYACRTGYVEAVSLLLQNEKCPVNAQDKDGKTALHHACATECSKAVSLLLQNDKCLVNAQDKDGKTALHHACATECSKAVSLLLQNDKCLVNAQDKDGKTALHHACATKCSKAVSLLLHNDKCLVNAQDKDGKTALHHACATKCSKAVSLLLQNDKCLVNAQDKDGKTALHHACATECSKAVSLLLQNDKCLVNAQDKDGKTALHHACATECSEVVKILVAYKSCKLNLTDKEEKVPLQLVLDKRNYQIAKFLLQNERCDPYSLNEGSECYTSLHLACEMADYELVLQLLWNEKCQLIINSKDDNGKSALHYACKKISPSYTKIAKLLLVNKNCNRNITDRSGRTPLHYACVCKASLVVEVLVADDACKLNICDDYGKVPLQIALEEKDYDTIRILLLTRKYDLAELMKKYTECTPLHVACKNADLEVISQLTSSNKYLIDLQDSFGKTPLHYICGAQGSDALLEATKLLLDSGCCNVNIRDKQYKTALCEAMESKNYGVFKFLLNSGKCDLNFMFYSRDCSILHVACDRGCFEAIALLIANSECLTNIQDMYGKTALHYICRKNLKGAEETITYMLERGCDPSVVDHSYKTPLFVALHARNYMAIESLLQCGKCDPNVLYKRMVSCAPHSACNEDNCNLFTPLHFACSRGDYKAVTILLSNSKCRINAQDSEGCTPLHYCCKKGDQQAVEFLLSNCNCNPNICNNQGLYPLQLAFQIRLEVYRVLLLSGKCDCNIVIDEEGRMPIHIACENGDIQVLSHLLSGGKCITTAQDLKGKTALHYACSRGGYKAMTTLLSNTKIDTNAQDSEGCTPLHYCCKKGDQLQAVEFLLSNCNCNPNICNNQGLYPLQLAFQTRLEVYRVLLLSGKCNSNIVIDEEGRMPIHIACKNGDIQVLSRLLSGGKCITTAQDLKGKTALHYACIAANIEAVRILLVFAKSDPTCTDIDGKTPVDYAKNYDILRQLFKHGANPSAMYHRFVLRKTIPESPVKVFVVGDGGSGKSTLVESLQRESRLDGTRSVENQTAGIVPNDFNSREYGQVTLFDFAGQKQFYGTHEAFLNSAIGSSPPIFVLVLDMSAKKSLQMNLLYWQTFLQNPCVHLTIKPHLVVICSHIDILRESQEDPQMKFAVIDHVMRSISASWCEFVGVVGIDCRQPRSNQMSSLRQILKSSCNELRIKTVLDFNCHCCFVYLLHKFRSSPAITIAMIIAEIQAEPESAKTSDGYLNFIPETNYHLCQVLEKLNDRGHIIFIKNNSELENSWVIIDRTALFNKISGAIFAPKNFKENFNISTNTGVVPLSKMKGKFFPEYDIDLLIAFLSHMEYCHEVTDRETLQLLMTEQQSSKDERYFLFPSLVTVDAPKSVWLSEAHDDNDFKFGFLMKCQDSLQFFTPRFLQVLILRLAFGYAMSPDSQSDNTQQLTEIKINLIHLSVLKRKCQVWKNGIFWGTNQGIECLVSISEDNQTLILLMKSKTFTSNCLQYRSTILKKITSIKKELTRLKVTEYIIDPNDTQYPLTLEGDMNMTTLDEIIKVMVECNEAAVTPTGRALTVDHLLTFEPYAKLGKGILKQLLSSQSQHKVPDSFMTRLASQWINKKHTVISLFNPDPILLSGKISEMGIPGPASEILCTLQLWRDIDRGNEGTYKCLREKLDQFSICCGKNPLVSVFICNDPMLHRGKMYTKWEP